MKLSNGVTLAATDRVRVVATGLRRASRNLKTGPMVQIFAHVRGIHPAEAQRTGKDAAVCFACPRRPRNVARAKARGDEAPDPCYVRVAESVAAVARAEYPAGAPSDLPAGVPIRFGAYGEPTLLPLAVLRSCADRAGAWTGYTARWRAPAIQAYRSHLMASCMTRQEAIEAHAMGWRTYRRLAAGEEPLPWERECAFYTRGTQCIDCLGCGGTEQRPFGASGYDDVPGGIYLRHDA